MGEYKIIIDVEQGLADEDNEKHIESAVRHGLKEYQFSRKLIKVTRIKQSGRR